MTGSERLRSSARIAATRPKPSSVGIITSARTRSGGVVANAIERGAAIADDFDAIVLSENAAEIVAHVRVVVGDQDTSGRLRRIDKASRGSVEGCRSPVRPTRPSWAASEALLRRTGWRRSLVEAQLPGGVDPFGRQVRCPRPNRHRERRPAAFLAGDRDAAAMKPGQLLHQGQADARAFVRAGASVLDAVEPFEHARQIVLGNADAGIGDAKLDAVAVRFAVPR